METVCAFAALVPTNAWIVAVVAVATGTEVAEKATDVAPAGTVTVAGTPTEVELLVKFTTMPPAGAAALRVTVPSVVSPPITEVGVAVMELT